MSEKVYGICGTNKCKKEVIPKEESYTKTEVNALTISKWESYPEIVSNLKSTFNEDTYGIYLKFIGDMPVLVFQMLSGGSSFKNKSVSFTIPWTSAIEQFKQTIIDNTKRYEATWVGHGSGGLLLVMCAVMYPKSEGLNVTLYHEGHGESGVYQYSVGRSAVFQFGASPN